MRRIDPKQIALKPFELLDDEWGLLVGGTDAPNPMTVSWGGFGTLWNRPVVTVYVRPTRFTYGLLNGHPEFTLSFVPEQYREALDLCGSQSGREGEKWTAASIHPARSAEVAVPRVAEAKLAFECRTVAHFDFRPEDFLDRRIEANYPERDYHRAFVGEVLAAWVE